MPTLVAVCLVLITLGLWVNIVFVVATMIEVRRAAQAVEVVAYRVGENVERFTRATALIQDFASNVRSGWLRGLGLAASAVATLWPGRKRRAERAAANDGG